MTWITRCPACASVYKLVPDQLKVASGWLRCGQCQHAFDSTGLVLPWPDASTLGVDQGGAQGLVVTLPDQRVVIDELLHHEDRSEAVQPLVADSPVNAQTDTMSELTAFSDALSSFRPLDLPVAGDAVLASDPVVHADRVDAPWDDDRVDDSGDGALDGVSPAAAGRRRVLVACALLLLLVVQGVWSQRHALATFFPQSAPVLQRICQLAGCDIRPWRQPDGIVIDSSDFVRQQEGFALRWTVRNTTALTLGMTSLELKLQDAQDKPLVRRVFDPAQVGAPTTLLPGQSWSGQLHIEVDANVPVTGYRLLSFYP